ncbi:MAG: sugar ABC transporter substrate-binding protein [Roseiarcus sp.]
MKRGWFGNLIAAGLLAGAGYAGTAMADSPDDGLQKQANAAMKGKNVAFVPIAMGFDLTEAWAAGLKLDAAALGYKLTIRDPNWSVDAGAQAISQLIAEKPDVLVVHPPEIQAYTRLIQQAAAAGIPVVTMNLKSEANGDVYIGADWYDIAVKQTEAMAKLCGKDSGKSGKIAVMQGVLTNPTSQFGIQAVQDTLKKYPELKIVSNQAADWDASKAHAITATILKANPDLCGIIGFWDNMDVGTAAAVKEAGKTGQVYIVTSGGGNQASACDNVANGNFATYISYDAKGQARDLMMAVRGLLQQKPATPGEKAIGLYTPLRTISKDTLYSGACWNLDDVKKYGP